MTTDWQPIETAPRDGTRVLLYIPGVGVSTGSWDKLFSRWEDDGIKPMPFLMVSTHWMPLPEPPTSNAQTPSTDTHPNLFDEVM